MSILNNDINPAKVLSAAVTGTSMMTLFSYLVSETKNQNFREPELLGKLLHRMVPELSKTESQVAGWNLHYAVGLIFAICYAKLWNEGKMKPTIASGLLLGGLSGALGIIVWKLTFRSHPFPPKIRFRKYYRHLLITHFVFGVFASIGYNLIRSNQFPITNPKKTDIKTEVGVLD